MNQYPYHIWETVLWSLVTSFPFIPLVLYTFRGHWRFGKKVTFAFSGIILVVQTILREIQFYMVSESYSSLCDMIIAVFYILFIFIALKEHIGKLIFTVLVLSNLGDFSVYCGKFLENLFFPECAKLQYHFTYPLFMMLILLVELPLIYLFVFRNICSHDAAENDTADHENIGNYLWRYLWIVPAVFYLIEAQFFYASHLQGFESFMSLINNLYLLIIDVGTVIIYRIIIQTAELYKRNTALLTENHVLSIQRLQYDSLNERLENMRRTRHDLRHHTALLRQIRQSGDISALDELIDTYTEENCLDQPLVFCENETVNIVLAFYSERAYKNNIAFSVKADIPEDIFADRKDLAVLFGNLLENAADACTEVEDGRFIDLTSTYKTTSQGKHSLSVIIKNSFVTAPTRTENGLFKSTKHVGEGIGTGSVEIISKKYDGTCSFRPDGSVFTVSVILYE